MLTPGSNDVVTYTVQTSQFNHSAACHLTVVTWLEDLKRLGEEWTQVGGKLDRRAWKIGRISGWID
jgi:hypothetical protein